MASVSNDLGGTRRIQFIAADHSRKTIRLGKISQRLAESVKIRVEALVSRQITGGSLDRDTSAWLTKISDELRDKLARVGLVDAYEAITLQQAIDAFKQKRGGAVKPQTRVNWGHTFRNLLEHFGPNRRVTSVSVRDADLWRAYLVELGLATATVNKRVRNAKMLFQDAVRNGWIASSPFEDLKAPVIASAHKQFIDKKTIANVLEQAPDTQWRLLIALARYGGLRHPQRGPGSEVDGHRLGQAPYHNHGAQDHPPRRERSSDDPPVPRVASVPVGRLRTGRGGAKACDHHLQPEMHVGMAAKDDGGTDPSGGPGAVAEGLPESTGQPGDRTGPEVSAARGLPLDW